MHVLTVGISFSGKTVLNKFLAEKYKDNNVIVFDPVKSSGWPESATKFSSAKKFLEHLETASDAYVFVDEAKILWDFDSKLADKALYSRRHQGLLFFLIAQRIRMVPPNARNMCTTIYAFRQQQKDAEILKDEYHDDFIACRNLINGEFLIYHKGILQPGHLDFDNKKIIYQPVAID